jgi:hypothetical protein
VAVRPAGARVAAQAGRGYTACVSRGHLGSEGRIDRLEVPPHPHTHPHRRWTTAADLGLPTSSLPLTRDELRKHDPAGYGLMEMFWRSVPYTVANDFPVHGHGDRVAACGRRSRLFDLPPGKEKEFDGWAGMSLVATDLLDGTEHRSGSPERDGKVWRLNPAAPGPTGVPIVPAPGSPR